ncbi:MAG: amidohydrolase [Clostridia bacterium]|nr:amidohydrolase [Clostridia bacterium]
MKQKISAVEKYRELIFKTQDYIWKNPETGFKEYKTSKYMEEEFKKLGYDLVMAEGITGFYTILDTGRPGPEVLVLGELDSLICKDHPDADPETGAVHCCGHSAQCAALLGLAAALKEPGVLDDLSGRIRLCAVPAEELIEIEFRQSLIKEGKIKYMGGKTEFMYRGYFDGVDIAFMVHTSVSENFGSNIGSVGCMAKRIVFKGKAAHAGGCPWMGVNALYAATQGLSAINAIRETFQERDIIRVHPIITTGGQAVNAIPDHVVIESFVRSENFDGMKNANERVNRAVIGAALSLGANVDIQDNPGYGPLKNAPGMIDLAKDAAEVLGIPFTLNPVVGSGSTDMGDLSCVMPAIHPYAGGAVGNSHGKDYFIEDPEMACVNSAKWQLAMLSLLLENGGERAKKIKEEFTPRFASFREYLDYIDGISSSGDRIEYNGDGTCKVKLK